MARRLSFAAACLLVLSTIAAPAQTNLTSTPDQKRSLFCDLCKIQDCSCNSAGDACTGCGLTANTGGSRSQQIDVGITTKACSEAKGRSTSGRCSFK